MYICFYLTLSPLLFLRFPLLPVFVFAAFLCVHPFPLHLHLDIFLCTTIGIGIAAACRCLCRPRILVLIRSNRLLSLVIYITCIVSFFAAHYAFYHFMSHSRTFHDLHHTHAAFVYIFYYLPICICTYHIRLPILPALINAFGLDLSLLLVFLFPSLSFQLLVS
ncbi:hypothetical protein DFH11DRAFT_1241133 [Phellopilus nigrolimitatus]|nr:hypothetical protein DFH11DRAFT_1241133 [Phellopilus nigrolimitatus]